LGRPPTKKLEASAEECRRRGEFTGKKGEEEVKNDGVTLQNQNQQQREMRRDAKVKKDSAHKGEFDGTLQQ